VNDERVVAQRGLLDPEAAEGRKFLAARIGRSNGQTARRHAEILPAGDGAIKARPLKYGELRLRAAVLGVQHSKSREAEVGRGFRDV
jgi:hypothetical protein